MMVAADATTVMNSVLTGGLAGLLASVVGQILLGDRPWLQVKAFHDVHFDRESGEVAVSSYVKIANVRGRPVRIEHVAILQRGRCPRPAAGPRGFRRPWAKGRLSDSPSIARSTRTPSPSPSTAPVVSGLAAAGGGYVAG
ncbi:MAG TPA: hypothetical protein VGA74_01380 [Actinomycetota bacterium]